MINVSMDDGVPLRRSNAVLAVFTASLVAAAARGGETGAAPWASFRGPNGSGVALGADLPSLDPARPHWKIAIESGYSSPVVGAQCVYLTTCEGVAARTVAIDRRTGEIRWRADAPQPLPEGPRGMNSPVSPTPVTDDERVWSLYPHYGLACYDRDGKETWRTPLGPFRIPHGMSSSPVLAGDKLILLCDQDMGSALYAFDAKTGAALWKTDRPNTPHSYSTPSVYHATGQGAPSQIVVSGAYQIAAYALDSGEKLWWMDGASWNATAIPVVRDGVAYVSSFMGTLDEYGAPRSSGPWEDALAEHDADHDGKIAKTEWTHEGLQQLWFIYDLDGDGLLGADEWSHAVKRGTATGGFFAIALDGRGDVTQTHVRWSYKGPRGLTGIPSPIVHDGLIYMVKEGGLLTSLDAATGAVVKQERIGRPDEYYASLVCAGGRILAASHSGQLTIVRAEGRDWTVEASHDLEEEIWSTPAIADGRVFIRTVSNLWCFGEERK